MHDVQSTSPTGQFAEDYGCWSNGGYSGCMFSTECDSEEVREWYEEVNEWCVAGEERLAACHRPTNSWTVCMLCVHVIQLSLFPYHCSELVNVTACLCVWTDRAVWYDAASHPRSWELDATEGPCRIRRRLQRCQLRMKPHFLLPHKQHTLSNTCLLTCENVVTAYCIVCCMHVEHE